MVESALQIQATFTIWGLTLLNFVQKVSDKNGKNGLVVNRQGLAPNAGKPMRGSIRGGKQQHGVQGHFHYPVPDRKDVDSRSCSDFVLMLQELSRKRFAATLVTAPSKSSRETSRSANALPLGPRRSRLLRAGCPR